MFSSNLAIAVVTSVALSFSLIESASRSGPMAEHFKSFWMRSLVQQKEDARTVAQAFIETGKLDTQEGADLLEEYFAEMRPQEKSDDCKLSTLVNS